MNNYYELQDKAHTLWVKAQDSIDVAERRYTRGAINEGEWYASLAAARSLQEQAIELEKQAADAQVLYWRQKYNDELYARREQQQMESELRNQ